MECKVPYGYLLEVVSTSVNSICTVLAKVSLTNLVPHGNIEHYAVCRCGPFGSLGTLN